MSSTEDTARITLATPPRLALSQIASALPAILDSGLVACLRIDMPGASTDELKRACDTLRPLCHERDIACTIKDHFRLVVPMGLDGAEVDTAKVKLRDVRAEIGQDAILGASCGSSRHNGMVAAEAGADYVLFSPYAAPAELGDGTHADKALFQWWAEMIETPVVAEGGLDAEQVAELADIADFIVPDAAIWEMDTISELRALDNALSGK